MRRSRNGDAFLSSALLAAGSQLPTNRSGIQKIIKATASRLDKKHSPNFTLKSPFASSLFGGKDYETSRRDEETINVKVGGISHLKWGNKQLLRSILLQSAEFLLHS